jgi:hypothetical protein
VRERFDGLAGSIEFEQPAIVWEFESFQAMAEFFRSSGAGPSSLPPDKLIEMVQELQGVVERHNEADDGSVRITAGYTQVVARKRG